MRSEAGDINAVGGGSDTVEIDRDKGELAVDGELDSDSGNLGSWSRFGAWVPLFDTGSELSTGNVVRLLEDDESLCLRELAVMPEILLRVSESLSLSFEDRGLTRASLPYRSCSTPPIGILKSLFKLTAIRVSGVLDLTFSLLLSKLDSDATLLTLGGLAGVSPRADSSVLEKPISQSNRIEDPICKYPSQLQRPEPYDNDRDTSKERWGSAEVVGER